MKKLLKITGYSLLFIISFALIFSTYQNPANYIADMKDKIAREEKEYNTIVLEEKAKQKEIATDKQELYVTSLDYYAKSDKKTYLLNRDFWKSEIKRLNSITGAKIVDKYRIPEDLFYTFLVTDNPYISQTDREHYGSNGFMATDVATGGKQLELYAPDYCNTEQEYAIEAKSYPKTTGDSILLTNKDIQILIGHTSLTTDQKTVKTGDKIGKLNMTGVTTGYHSHIQYFAWVVDKWQEMAYKCGESNKSEVVNNPPASNKNGQITITTYNPTAEQNDDTPCIGGSGKDICELSKQGVRAIALSRDLLKKYPYGSKIKIDCSDDRCRGEFTVLDTMNVRWQNRADIFFMDSKDNGQWTGFITQ